MTCVSLAWVLGQLRPSRHDLLVTRLFAVSIVTEVALICLQQWRGVPSHFNRSTPQDAAILFAIKTTALALSVYIWWLTWRCLRARFARPDLGVAIRFGMGLLALSCLLGFWIEWVGESQVQLGRPPYTYGEAGVLKFAHGMPMHAIQFLPLLASVLGWLGLPARSRHGCVWLAALGLVGHSAFALWQTLRGRSRLDVDWFSGSLLLLSTLALTWPLVFAVWRRTRASAGSQPTANSRG
ncbi:hypothetical protein [Posidoniimonas polymericola]|uniref:hypothetical protein n=1 Tax=Posidoniimonas polymericola TaxID=2528002 RepID=UPI0011B78B69|nr:hypothetical protein [Posidoniimonas polymericola]